MKRVLIIFFLALSLIGCAGEDKSVIGKAEWFYAQRNAKIITYQGYSIGVFLPNCHWYVTQIGDTLYESCLMRWEGQIHEYSLKALNAIGPRQ